MGEFSLPSQLRFERELSSVVDSTPRALVRDQHTKAFSVAISASGAYAARSKAKVGVTQRHLAAVTHAAEEGPHQTFVAEHIAGNTLVEIARLKRVDSFKALIWFSRLLEAVAAIHEASAVHGAISPFAIVVEPDKRGIAPVLTQLLFPPYGPFCSPERLLGGPPTSSDDVWSLMASLYFAVTGEPPFGSETGEQVRQRVRLSQLGSLSRFGLEEPELDRLFAAVFHHDERRRLTKLPKIREAFQTIERGERLVDSLVEGESPSLRPSGQLTENERVIWSLQSLVSLLHETKELPLASAPRASRPGEVPSHLSSPKTSTPAAPRAGSPPSRGVAHNALSSPEITLGPQVSLGPEDSIWPQVAPNSRESATRGKPSQPPPFAKKELSPTLAAFVGGLIAATSTLFFILSSKKPEGPTSPVEAALPAAPKEVLPSVKRPAKVEPSECLLSYFPAHTFASKPNLQFVCSERDFQLSASSLFALVLSEAEKRAGEMLVRSEAAPLATQTSPANRREPKTAKGDSMLASHVAAALPYQAELGWYELAGLAIMKRNCCPSGAQSIEVPRTEGYCPQLGDVLQVLADASTRPGDLSPQARRFDEAASCLVTTKTTHPFGHEGAPTPENRAAFQRFLTYAAVSDARRSAMRR